MPPSPLKKLAHQTLAQMDHGVGGFAICSRISAACFCTFAVSAFFSASSVTCRAARSAASASRRFMSAGFSAAGCGTGRTGTAVQTETKSPKVFPGRDNANALSDKSFSPERRNCAMPEKPASANTRSAQTAFRRRNYCHAPRVLLRPGLRPCRGRRRGVCHKRAQECRKLAGQVSANAACKASRARPISSRICTLLFSVTSDKSPDKIFSEAASCCACHNFVEAQ